MEGQSQAETDRAPAGVAAWHAFVRRHEWALLAAVLLVAALVRVVRSQLTAVMFNDGPAFLALAQAIGEGDWRFALGHPFHPLYPALIAAVEPLAGDWERAAVAVAVAGGTLAVAALYLLVREMLGPLHAWVAAALLAVHPRGIEYAGDIQSEGVYLALFLGSAALLFRGLQRGERRSAFGGGLLGGAAYLTRPEGLGVLAVSLAFVGFWWLRGRWSFARTFLWSAAALAGAALFMVPYVAWLRAEEGVWMVSQKKSLAVVVGIAEHPQRGPDPLTATALLGLEDARKVREEAPEHGAKDAPQPDESPAEAATGTARAAEPATEGRGVRERPAEPAWEDGEGDDDENGIRLRPDADLRELASTLGSYLRTHFRAIRYQMLILLVAGWALRPSLRPGLPGTFVLVTIGAYMTLLLGLAMNVGYVSNRHALPVMVLTFGYAADGVLRIGGVMARRRPPAQALRRATAASILAFAVVAGIGLAKALRPDRVESLGERRAAEWLHEQDVDVVGVAVRKRRTAYYAGAPYVVMPSAASPGGLRQRGASHLILAEEDVRRYPKLDPLSPPYARLLHREEVDGRATLVFELGPLDEP